MDYTVARSFNSMYVIMDILWLIVFAGILISRKKYQAVVVGLLAGLLYMLVDYGIFYHMLGTREVVGATPFWLLLWLSMSYGFTNFAWIWLLLDRDGNELEWSMMPIMGWMMVGMMSQSMGANMPAVSISRQVASYHGYMALILVVGYLLLVLQNVKGKRKSQKAPLGRLLLIGIGVQLAWESTLLLSEIRPPGMMPLIINSLVETNLGMPYIYLIHKWYTSRRNTARASA